MRNLAKKEGEKFPGSHPPTKSEGSKMYFSEKGRLRSQAPAWFLCRALGEYPLGAQPQRSHPGLQGQGLSLKRGQDCPVLSCFMGLSTTQHRNLCVSRLDGRI